jgi:peptide/nickel transport system substrate-binding protein
LDRWKGKFLPGLALAVTAALALGSVGCSNAGSGAARSKATGPFIIDAAQAPATLDPAVVAGQYDTGHMVNFYTTLVKFSDDKVAGAPAGVTVTRETNPNGVVPYMAKSYDVSTDGKAITFHLNPGVKFSTGRPVDAAAVVANYARVKALKSTAESYLRATQTDLNPIWEAVDQQTVVVRLARPEALYLPSLAHPTLGIADVQAIKDNGGDVAGKPNQWIATHTAGSGPYLLKDYSPGARMVLEANPDFFGPKPLEKDVIVNFIPDDATLLLQARKADVTLGLTKKSVKSLVGNNCCNVVPIPTHTSQLLALPNNVPPFNNMQFREALTYAVPYNDILDHVAFGYGQLFYGPFAPRMAGYDAKRDMPRAYDLNKAKALIQASGVQVPINVQMIYQDNVLDQQQIATIVQASWKQIGVNITPTPLTSSVYNSANGIRGCSSRQCPLILRGDGSGTASPLAQLDYDMVCGGFNNIQAMCIPQADELLKQAHQTLDPQKLAQLFTQIATLWEAANPRIPIYAENYTVVLNHNVKYYRFAQIGVEFSRWGR